MCETIDEVRLLSQAVETSLLNRFPAFVFRMPGDDAFYWGACTREALDVLSGSELPETPEGFLFAPFDVKTLPAFFFPVKAVRAESVEIDALKRIGAASVIGDKPIECHDISYGRYKNQVENLVEETFCSTLKKAVLSRTVTLDRPSVSDMQLVLRLAAKYPSAFVSWVHLPGVGRWIGATPETLLDYDGSVLSTMALAGTRRAGSKEAWGEKEMEEQQIVTDYIVNALGKEGFATEVGERATRVAGQVEHLCTPISISGDFDRRRVSDILNVLHPTPAVGGYPKALAIDWIRRVEQHDRDYYGGYLGPVSGREIRLFVNLRCMEVNDTLLKLYVGGGLTAQSRPEDEWNETEAKAQTLLSVINE